MSALQKEARRERIAIGRLLKTPGFAAARAALAHWEGLGDTPLRVEVTRQLLEKVRLKSNGWLELGPRFTGTRTAQPALDWFCGTLLARSPAHAALCGGVRRHILKAWDRLSAEQRTPPDLDYLAAFPALEELFVDGLSLFDAGALQACPALWRLSLKGRQEGRVRLVRLEALTHCGLRELTLTHGAEADPLAPLAGHQTLERLEILEGALEQLPPLPALREVELRRLPALRSIEGLRGAAALEVVGIEQTPALEDLEPLAGLPKLRQVGALSGVGTTWSSVALRGLGARSLDPIAPVLQQSGASDILIEACPQIEALPEVGRVPTLRVRRCDALRDLSTLRESPVGHLIVDLLPALSRVADLPAGLGHLQIGDCPQLSELQLPERLTRLSLRGLPALPDLRCLRGRPRISVLWLQGLPRVADLAPLEDCAENLRELRLLDREVPGGPVEIERIARMRGLHHLQLPEREEPIDLHPLAVLGALRMLSLPSHSRVVSLMPLMAMPSLRHVLINGNMRRREQAALKALRPELRM